MSPKSLRRAGIAAFGLALLLATAVGSPARAGERAAEEAFERLVSEREDALRARARRARARPEVRPGATRPLVIYRASADDLRAELSASASRGWLGGYYVAMTADEIVAYPTSVVGSIGVVFTLFPNLSGLMERWGIEDQTLVSGPYKDSGSFLRKMRPDERVELQSIIDDLHLRFVDVVEGGRANLTREQIETIADGRIFSAYQAREHGLVDHVGDLEFALSRARAAAGVTEARVVTYHRPREYRKNLYTQLPTGPPRLEVNLLPDWPNLKGPAFLYLWMPGLR